MSTTNRKRKRHGRIRPGEVVLIDGRPHSGSAKLWREFVRSPLPVDPWAAAGAGDVYTIAGPDAGKGGAGC